MQKEPIRNRSQLGVRQLSSAALSVASLPVIDYRIIGPRRRNNGVSQLSGGGYRLRLRISGPSRWKVRPAMASSLRESFIVHDVCVAALTSGVALGLLRFWEEMAKRRVFEEKLNRKLVHVTAGLVFMLLWPLFSSQSQAAYLAALAPAVNTIRMLLLGLGILKNDAMMKSMCRSGDYRELLKGPLYYAATITLATGVFWRTSPIAIAAVCNLCAGDGFADIVGRRYGWKKLPYNPAKSIMGSIGMTTAGFLASILYMHYFSLFGYIKESRGMAASFLMISMASAFIESLPISTELDDNLTVTLTSVFVGSFLF